MNVWTKRALWGMLCLIFGLALALTLAYRLAWNRYAAALDVLEPRIQRLAGIVQMQTDIASQLESVSPVIASLLHPGTTSSSNQVQQTLRQLIDASGLVMVASQAVVEETDSSTLSRFKANVTVTGEWGKAIALLDALGAHRPPLWIRSSVLMREAGSQTAEPQLVRLVMQVDAPVERVGAP